MIDLYFKRDYTDYFYNCVSKDFWNFHIAGPELEKHILKRFFYVNLFVSNYLIASLMCVLLIILFPMVDMPEGVRSLPNIIWTPFDTNPSPLHEIIYVVMVWNLSLSIFGNAFFDVLYIYGLQHLYVQYSLLKELLKNLPKEIMDEQSDLKKFYSDYFQEKVLGRLNICMKHHSKLLK